MTLILPRKKGLVTRRQLMLASACAGMAGGWSRGSFGCHVLGQMGDSNSLRGQSMTGGVGYDPAIDVPTLRCLEHRYQAPSLIRYYTDIADHQLDYETAVPVDGIGPMMTFMREYWLPHKLPAGMNVAAAVVGVGGTGMVNGYWLAPSGAGIIAFVTKLNHLIAADSRNVPKCILWTTGANDANAAVTQAQYQTWAETTVDYIRANVTGGANIPIVFEGLSPVFYPITQPVWLALANMPNLRSQCGYVDTSDLATFTGTISGGTNLTVSSVNGVSLPGGVGAGRNPIAIGQQLWYNPGITGSPLVNGGSGTSWTIDVAQPSVGPITMGSSFFSGINGPNGNYHFTNYSQRNLGEIAGGSGGFGAPPTGGFGKAYENRSP